MTTAPVLAAVPDAPSDRWTAESYQPAVTSEAQGVKLAASGVSPLVAVAAGLRTLNKETARPFGEDVLGGSPLSAARRQLIRMCTPAGLLMPWYRPDALVEAWTIADRVGGRTDPTPTAASLQVRPDEPTLGADGKPRKYENLAGQSTVIGVHPSAPRSWMGARRVLLTEGLIKGLSALTAVLLAGGVTREALDLTEAECGMGAETAGEAARARLRDLMAGVDTDKRILVLTVVGVGNWHHNPEWNAIDLREGREVMVAFDADVATNAAVHRQASQLVQFIEHRGGAAVLLRPALDGDPHAGIDDFLAATDHDLGALLSTATDELPPAPEPEARPGAYRMDWSSGTSSVARATEDGGVVWAPAEQMAGRLAATRVRLSATDEDVLTGRVPEPSRVHQGGAVVEVKWTDLGHTRTGTIEGPVSMLDARPDELSKSERVYVPASVVSLPKPTWPPSREWWGAVKAERRGELEERASYVHSGYVPTERGMAYICGSDVVDSHGRTNAVEAGAAELGGTTDGFGLHPWEGGVRKGREKLREDLVEVLTAYAGAWGDERYPAVALAAAMRPAVPLPTNSVLFFEGGKGSGKSWTARSIMQFHRRSLGTWTGTSLPGTASSTEYAIEQAVSQNVLWVADDLAPSTNRHQAARDSAKLANAARNVHNRTSKARGKGEGLAAQFPPRALLIITAENALNSASAESRTVALRFGPTSLRDGGKDALNAMNHPEHGSLAPARIFTAGVQAVLASVNRTGSWAGTVAEWQVRRKAILEYATEKLNGDARAAHNAAELAVGLEVLADLCGIAGIGEEWRPRLEGWVRAIVQTVAEQADAAAGSSPGQMLVDALADDLTAGRCHVAVPGSGDAPTLPGWDLATLAQITGWRLPGGRPNASSPNGVPEQYITGPGVLRGEGPTVGWLVTEPDKRDRPGRPCVLVSPQAAQDVLVRDGGAIPHGTRIRSSLAAAAAEGLTSTAWKEHRGLHRVKVGRAYLTGVAIPLEILFPAANEDDDDAPDRTDDAPPQNEAEAKAAEREELEAKMAALQKRMAALDA